MIRRRLALRFVLQLAAAGALLTVLAVLIVIWMLDKLTDIEISRNFAPLGISRMISESDVDAQGLLVDPGLLERLREDGGWLQSLDEKGNVLQSFNAPNDLPAQYIPGQLIDYWTDAVPFPYQLGLWIQEKDGRIYTLLYGIQSMADVWLERVIADGRLSGNRIVFTDDTVSLLEGIEGWVQVLDWEGQEVASWGKPEDAPTTYALQELALRVNNRQFYGTAMDTRYDERTGLTWVIQHPLNRDGMLAGRAPFIHSEVQVMIAGIAAFLISSLIVFTLLALWYAYRFGTPILLMLGWIQKLGQGDYDELAQEKEEASGRYRQDRRKRKYRLFGEIMDSIHSLAGTLKEGKRASEQTQRNREEWIAGVTHDMKTPITSIQGYAHMLEAEKYRWSEEEVRRFASKIVEKTAYMDRLIDDLALTYRLRSGDVPVSFVMTDINALLTESVEHAGALPAHEGRTIQCSVPQTPVYAAVHPPWLRRIIQNVAANGVIHNPPGTRIDIVLTGLPNQAWRLDFRDNGRGMDAHTAGRLFDRYYRGTNTDSAMEGSGLGMAVTKELVLAMNGRIEVDSKLGEGTVISMIWDARRGQ